MPGYKTHATAGAVMGAATLAVAATVGVSITAPLIWPPVIVAALAGALFPDVDTDSKGQNILYALLIVVDVGLILAKRFSVAALLGLAAMLPAVGHHRGWTHTFWAALAIPAPILLAPMAVPQISQTLAVLVYCSAAAGYFSHILLDRIF